MSGSTGYAFHGWLGKSPDAAAGNMVWERYEPKKWTEDDVDIQITHCGICGSDLRTLSSGWGPTAYPCCVGHEIVGKAVRVGANVKHIQHGDRVGVGAQARSCLQPNCSECSVGKPNYFSAMGGYADHNRTNGHFVIKIPEDLASELAAPMIRWGVVGVGGLGHFAVLFARALGADRVVAVSRKVAKRDEVLKLGAHDYIATEDEQQWRAKQHRTLDLIVSTVSSDKMPLQSYLSLLKVAGTFVQLGLPDGGNFPPVNAFTLIQGGIKIAGSAIGSPGEIRDMLRLAADKKIHPWVQTRPLEEVNQAIVDMKQGKARYRHVLVNQKHL